MFRVAQIAIGQTALWVVCEPYALNLYDKKLSTCCRINPRHEMGECGAGFRRRNDAKG